MDIFPFLQPVAAVAPVVQKPIYKDVEWNYSENKPVFEGMNPKMVSGLPAVMSWAWRAIHTNRFINEIYSWNYGSELVSLIGQEWIPAVKEAEAARYIKECLTQHPNINDVIDIESNFDGSTLTISCRVVTDYGTEVIDTNV